MGEDAMVENDNILRSSPEGARLAASSSSRGNFEIKPNSPKNIEVHAIEDTAPEKPMITSSLCLSTPAPTAPRACKNLRFLDAAHEQAQRGAAGCISVCPSEHLLCAGEQSSCGEEVRERLGEEEAFRPQRRNSLGTGSFT